MTEQASNAAFQVSSAALPDLNGSEQVGSGTKQVCKPHLSRNDAVGQASRLSQTSKKLRLESFFNRRVWRSFSGGTLIVNGDRRDACPTR